jgi:Uma2 family endonuclease
MLTQRRDIPLGWHPLARGDNVEPMAGTPVTWRDVQAMPEDGQRYEAIAGDVYLTPAPKTRHQLVSMNLTNALLDVLVRPGHGILFSAPVGVEFPETEEGVQPDLVLVRASRRHIIGEGAIQGAPDLVIEILSRGTAHRDRGIKLQLYRRQGVAQYWVVDPEAKRVEVWRLAEGAPDAERYTGLMAVRIGAEVVGAIEVLKLFDWPA